MYFGKYNLRRRYPFALALRGVASAYFVAPDFNPGLGDLIITQRTVGSAHILWPEKMIQYNDIHCFEINNKMGRAYGSHLIIFATLQRVETRCYNMFRAYGSYE